MDLADVVGSEELGGSDDVETFVERRNVVVDFFACWVDCGAHLPFVEFVIGGDDVFDLGAGFGFLEWESVEEDVFVWDKSKDTFEFC